MPTLKRSKTVGVPGTYPGGCHLTVVGFHWHPPRPLNPRLMEGIGSDVPSAVSTVFDELQSALYQIGNEAFSALQVFERVGHELLPGKDSFIFRADVARAFKSLSAIACNRSLGRTGRSLWQRNYYEHIIRDEESLDSIRRYIADNPVGWALDRENPANL